MRTSWLLLPGSIFCSSTIFGSDSAATWYSAVVIDEPFCSLPAKITPSMPCDLGSPRKAPRPNHSISSCGPLALSSELSITPSPVKAGP